MYMNQFAKEGVDNTVTLDTSLPNHFGDKKAQWKMIQFSPFSAIFSPTEHAKVPSPPLQQMVHFFHCILVFY